MKTRAILKLLNAIRITITTTSTTTMLLLQTQLYSSNSKRVWVSKWVTINELEEVAEGKLPSKMKIVSMRQMIKATTAINTSHQ